MLIVLMLTGTALILAAAWFGYMLAQPEKKELKQKIQSLQANEARRLRQISAEQGEKPAYPARPAFKEQPVQEPVPEGNVRYMADYHKKGKSS